MTAESQDRREEPAVSLLSDPESAELRWIESVNPNLPKGGLKRVNWADVGSTVTIPAWTSAVAELAPVLGENTVESLSQTVKDLAANVRAAQTRPPRGTNSNHFLTGAGFLRNHIELHREFPNGGSGNIRIE